MAPENEKTDRYTQYLANERTFLAWLRTCIALMGLGFVVARFSLFLREFSIMTKNQAIPPNLPTVLRNILGYEHDWSWNFANNHLYLPLFT
jgi:putative membrane protein